MKRLFIIGAGFSHALTGLPLGRDLANLIFTRVREISPRQKRLYDLAHSYLRVWEYLQDQSKPLRDYLQSDGTQIKDLSDGEYPTNLEYLLTLIDLNLNEPYVPKGIGVDLTGCPIPYLKGISHFTLNEAREFIQHQIYELMEPGSYPSLDEDRFRRMMSFFSSGDVALTFNYDLFLEQGLFTAGLWNPIDGYGLGEMCENEIIVGDMPPTRVALVKLHGSINWTRGSQIVISPDVVIHAANFDNNSLFNGLDLQSNHPPYHRRYPRDPIIVMPTYLKFFDQSFEVGLINRAISAAREADEVYMLGYSLPKADVTANLIVSQIRRSTKIIIVNRIDASEIRDRLRKTYGFNRANIIYEQTDIRTWIDNDFEYLQYQHEQEGRAFFQDILRTPDL